MKVDIGKREVVFVSIILTVFVFGVVVAQWSAQPVSHGADQMKVTIGGTDYSLQEAIDGGLIGNNFTKAWVNFDGDTSPYTIIRDSYNVDSVVYQPGAIYTVKWKNSFSDSNYTVSITTSKGPVRISKVTPNDITFQVFSISTNPGAEGANYTYVVAFDK